MAANLDETSLVTLEEFNEMKSKIDEMFKLMQAMASKEPSSVVPSTSVPPNRPLRQGQTRILEEQSKFGEDMMKLETMISLSHAEMTYMKNEEKLTSCQDIIT